MTNWRERAEQHISSQDRMHLEAKRAREERLRELEAQRNEEIRLLWQTLNVPQELRRINSQIWGSQGDVVVNDSAPDRKLAALVFRYQFPVEAGRQNHYEKRFGFYEEKVIAQGFDAGGGYVGTRRKFGSHEVLTGHTNYWMMVEHEAKLSVEVGGVSAPLMGYGVRVVQGKEGSLYYAVFMHGQFLGNTYQQKFIQCSSPDLSFEEVKKFVDQELLNDCVFRSKYKDSLPDGLKQRAEAKERDLRSRGHIRKY